MTQDTVAIGYRLTWRGKGPVHGARASRVPKRVRGAIRPYPGDLKDGYRSLSGFGVCRRSKFICSQVPPARRHDAESNPPGLTFKANGDAGH